MLEKDHADGIWYFETAASRVEGAGFLVDGKNMQIPAGLVGRNDPLSGRVQIEVAGCPPPGFLDVDKAQLSTTLVNMETGDAVMAAV